MGAFHYTAIAFAGHDGERYSFFLSFSSALGIFCSDSLKNQEAHDKTGYFTVRHMSDALRSPIQVTLRCGVDF